MQVKQVKCNSDIKKQIQFTSNLIGSTTLINTLTKEMNVITNLVISRNKKNGKKKSKAAQATCCFYISTSRSKINRTIKKEIMKRSRHKNKANKSGKEEDKRLYSIQRNNVSKLNNFIFHIFTFYIL